MWAPVVLISVVALAAAGMLLLVRNLRARRGLSPEERREIAGAPMPPLQKRAWWSLLVGVATLSLIAAILTSVGAAAYWEDDALRLRVVGIFLVGLVLQAVLPALPMLRDELNEGIDERDRAILARAPVVQSTVVLLSLAAWLVALGQRFHDQGAVPMVYLYLIFGSIVLVHLTAHALGIVLGYRFGAGDGQD